MALLAARARARHPHEEPLLRELRGLGVEWLVDRLRRRVANRIAEERRRSEQLGLWRRPLRSGGGGRGRSTIAALPLLARLSGDFSGGLLSSLLPLLLRRNEELAAASAGSQAPQGARYVVMRRGGSLADGASASRGSGVDWREAPAGRICGGSTCNRK